MVGLVARMPLTTTRSPLPSPFRSAVVRALAWGSDVNWREVTLERSELTPSVRITLFPVALKVVAKTPTPCLDCPTRTPGREPIPIFGSLQPFAQTPDFVVKDAN